MDISLYLPCYNAEPFLATVLAGVFGQTLLPREVIVVDDGSTDRTAETAVRIGKSSPVPVRVVRHRGNLGLAEARNTGVRESAGMWVASLDADVAADPGWLKALAAEMDGREEVWGVGGELVEGHRTRPGDRWRDAHMRQSWGPTRRERPPFLFGSNTLFRREAILAAGGYDPRCRTNAEDVKLCEKIRDRCTLVYTPAARCTHLRRDTPLSVARTCWKWHYFGSFSPIDLAGTLSANARDVKKAGRLLSKDFQDRDPGNALVSLLFLAGSLFWDWRELARALANGRVQRGGKGARP
jgi:GT2 family glycosyltransferase